MTNSDDWTSLDKKAYKLFKERSRMEQDQIIAELSKNNKEEKADAEF